MNSPAELGHWWGAVAESLRNSGSMAADWSPLWPATLIKSYCKTIENSQIKNIIKKASLTCEEKAHLQTSPKHRRLTLIDLFLLCGGCVYVYVYVSGERLEVSDSLAGVTDGGEACVGSELESSEEQQVL